ncbi:MAG: biotin--[acetyl-CoA-carboxylase] ligase, partial [Bacteroidetes bacterium]|nr:biotin--[acetyl-CoA-carboxylase] ligase [Bacteroidota bacterium]
MSYPDTFRQDIPQPQIGNLFIELKTVDSSNNYAMAQVHDSKAFHGNVFFAHEQTAGKGQRGKRWMTGINENILMSVVLEPLGLALHDQFLLSASMALACFDLLNMYFPGNISLKWPNDLYFRDRKTGGILIENIISGENWKFAIVGIGININQTDFDETLPNPTSLKLVTEKNYDVIALAKELCVLLNKRYQHLVYGKKEKIISGYNSHLYKKNKKVKLKKGA